MNKKKYKKWLCDLDFLGITGKIEDIEHDVNYRKLQEITKNEFINHDDKNEVEEKKAAGVDNIIKVLWTAAKYSNKCNDPEIYNRKFSEYKKKYNRKINKLGKQKIISPINQEFGFEEIYYSVVENCLNAFKKNSSKANEQAFKKALGNFESVKRDRKDNVRETAAFFMALRYQNKNGRESIIEEFYKMFKKELQTKRLTEIFLDGILFDFDKNKYDLVDFLKKREPNQINKLVSKIEENIEKHIFALSVLKHDTKFNNYRIEILERAKQNNLLTPNEYDNYVKVIRCCESEKWDYQKAIEFEHEQFKRITNKCESTIKENYYRKNIMDKIVENAKKEFLQYDEVEFAKKYYKKPCPSPEFPLLINELIFCYFLQVNEKNNIEELKKYEFMKENAKRQRCSLEKYMELVYRAVCSV